MNQFLKIDYLAEDKMNFELLPKDIIKDIASYLDISVVSLYSVNRYFRETLYTNIKKYFKKYELSHKNQDKDQIFISKKYEWFKSGYFQKYYNESVIIYNEFHESVFILKFNYRILVTRIFFNGYTQCMIIDWDTINTINRSEIMKIGRKILEKDEHELKHNLLDKAFVHIAYLTNFKFAKTRCHRCHIDPKPILNYISETLY